MSKKRIDKHSNNTNQADEGLQGGGGDCRMEGKGVCHSPICKCIGISCYIWTPLTPHITIQKTPTLCVLCVRQKERETQRGSEKAHKIWQRCQWYTFCPCWMKIGAGAHWMNRKREGKSSIKKERDRVATSYKPDCEQWKKKTEKSSVFDAEGEVKL